MGNLVVKRGPVTIGEVDSINDAGEIVNRDAEQQDIDLTGEFWSLGVYCWASDSGNPRARYKIRYSCGPKEFPPADTKSARRFITDPAA